MKAILVVDLPNNVNMDRVIQTPVTLSFDLGGMKQMMFADGYLKPMPQKYYTDGDDIEENSYWQGWNECIEEIEK